MARAERWGGLLPPICGQSFLTYKREAMNMVGGLVASMVAFAVGAVLDFAVTETPYQHGFNIHTVGIILMIVGAVGAVLSLIAMLSTGFRRHRSVIDDGRGNVVRREDTYT
jgi:hypothetical protein